MRKLNILDASKPAAQHLRCASGSLDSFERRFINKSFCEPGSRCIDILVQESFAQLWGFSCCVG